MRDLIEAELRQADRLKQKHLDAFARDGIPALNLAKTWDGWFSFMHRAWCVFDDNGGFEFARHLEGGLAQSAFVFAVRDEYGDDVDVVAWKPPVLAVWLGHVALLGQEQVNGPRLGRDPLRVHTTVAGWFRAAREGVFVLDEARAADLLRCETLGAESAIHASDLRRRLTRPAPPVVVVEPMQAPTCRLHIEAAA